MTSNRLAQWIFEGTLKNYPAGRLGRWQSRFFHFLFRQVRKWGDPLIVCSLWDARLLLPFSHQLPFVLKNFPNYSLNLGRIASYAYQKYPNLHAIDVGCNIGDSVAIIHQKCPVPVLGLEGDAIYFKILEANQAALRPLKAVPCFVGETAGQDSMTLKHERGSASLSPTAGASVAVRPMVDILKDNVEFSRSKLLKIDTDGYDGKILRGAEAFLRLAHPVLFFEYVPDLLAQQDDNGLDIFRYLSGLGYQGILIYDNFGDFLLSAELRETRRLAEIDLYFTGRHIDQYCDIAVMHAEDQDLFESARQKEFDFYREQKRPHA